MKNTQSDPLVPGASPDPSSPDHAVIKRTNAARAGVAVGSMRWVLAISLVAVIAAFIVIWLIEIKPS